ncbi:MAG: phosphate ABC transporter substrate-binding protein [Planctomycetota bacterium]|nr:phosphate ABC transporter substrate-binding protein [Planctomycetota bacterium]
MSKHLRRISTLAVVAFCGLLAGCEGLPAIGVTSSEGRDSSSDLMPGTSNAPKPLSPLSGKLTITGSSTVAPLAAEMATRFEQRHRDVRIDVQTGGSSRGIIDVQSGLAGIGMASRQLSPFEAGLTAHRIAVDGVCLIVHKTNPVMTLTDEQVVAIYRGQVSNWSELGGADLPVVVVNKAAGRATLEVFLNHFGLDNAEIKADIIVGENQQGIKTVAGNPSAIAYVSIGTVSAEVERGTAIRSVPAGNVAPTSENVASGLYPITRPLLFVTNGELNDLQTAFIEFAQSPDVTDLIEAQYFVPPNR